MLQRDPVKRVQGKRRKSRDPIAQHPIGMLKGQHPLGLGPCRFDRVRRAPMRRHRLTRPWRAGLVCGAITDSENKIKGRRIGALELRHILRTQAVDVIALGLQHLHGQRVQLGLRLGASRKHREPITRDLAQDRFGKNRTGGIPGADEQDTVLAIGCHGNVSEIVHDGGGRAQIRPTKAAIDPQRRGHGVDTRKISAIAQRGAAAGAGDQPRLKQIGQIGAERVGLERQHRGDLTCGQQVGMTPDQQA